MRGVLTFTFVGTTYTETINAYGRADDCVGVLNLTFFGTTYTETINAYDRAVDCVRGLKSHHSRNDLHRND